MIRCSPIIASCTRCFSTALRNGRRKGGAISSGAISDAILRTTQYTTEHVDSKSEFKQVMGRIGSHQIHGLRASLSRNMSTYSLVSERKEGAAIDPIAIGMNDQVAENESQHLGWRQALAHRFKITAEVVVSKIFPAGFAWQGSSILAENWGMSADSFNFALTTGIGEGLGVITGHTLFMAVKKAATGNADIDIGAELQTGILLGSAAFCSGTAWQPVVDALADTGSGFNMVVTGTTVACGLAFFSGLRLARAVYPHLGMTAVEPATYSNLKADATLSLSIGGATGAFVGTDVSFGYQNWLRPTVGIEEGVGELNSMVTAGGSTALGFTVFQGLQNMTFSRDKSWVD